MWYRMMSCRKICLICWRYRRKKIYMYICFSKRVCLGLFELFTVHPSYPPQGGTDVSITTVCGTIQFRPGQVHTFNKRISKRRVQMTDLLSLPCIPTADVHLSSASAAPAQRHVAPVPGSRLCRRLRPPRSKLQVVAGVPKLHQPRRAGEDSGQAEAGGGGAAQGERHEVSLRVRGPLRRQHPGLVQHRDDQNTTCYRGKAVISSCNTYLFDFV